MNSGLKYRIGNFEIVLVFCFWLSNRKIMCLILKGLGMGMPVDWQLGYWLFS